MSIIDQIFTLRETQDSSLKQHMLLDIIFIAFKQADDSAIREKIYTTMNDLEIPAKLIRMVRITLDRNEK